MSYEPPSRRPSFTSAQQQQPYAQQPYAEPWAPQAHEPYSPPPQQGARHAYREAPPRKRRRIFLWVFLAIQALFLAWIIAGVASKPAGPTVAQQVAQYCANGGWSPLFSSYADCARHYAVALNDASDTGKGIGVALIIGLWVAVDVILGIGYGIYRLARRPG